MDISTLVIGLVIGLIIGFIISLVWTRASLSAKTTANMSTEAQLKALLAEQADHHLQASRGSIAVIEKELSSLRQAVTQYEQSLQVLPEDETSTAFFGEHASVFLRNTHQQSSTGTETKNDAQPKDFANNGSGLFAGNPTLATIENQTLVTQEKSNK